MRARVKAVRLLEYGGPLVFDDVPTPTIARDEILVKIRSTAVIARDGRIAAVYLFFDKLP